MFPLHLADYAEAEAKPQEKASSLPPAQILFMGAIDSKRNEDYAQERERRLNNVCGKWLTVIGHNYEAFAKILREFERSCRYEASKKVLSAAFGLKSPATLEKRTNSMSRYLICRKNNRNGFALPVRRSEAWEYITRFEEHRAGASAGSAFLEALRFSQRVLGLRDVDVGFSVPTGQRFG